MKKLLLCLILIFNCSVCFGSLNCGGDSGTEDMVIYSSDLGINSYPFTICVKWDPTAYAQNIIASLHNSGVGNNYYYLEMAQATNVVQIVARNTDFNDNQGTTNIGSGVHTVCGVWAGNADRKIYVDGKSNEIQGGIVSTSFNTSTNQFSICGSDDSTPTSNAQKILEIAVWSAELTESESAQYANGDLRRVPLQIQPSNLILYSLFDDYPDGTTSMGGNTFRDESGNGNNGSLVDTDGDTTALAEIILSYP